MEAVNPRLDALLETPELAALGPGPRAGRQSIPDLDRALAAIFGPAKKSTEPQALIRALVLLWHDHLDAAHSLSQDVPTADGSFIHGIMHRREPDYGNAKYWFHRVGSHEAFRAIAERAAAIPASATERALLERFNRNDIWDPFAFIDICQEEEKSSSDHETFLRQIQKSEFSALLEHLAARVQFSNRP
jgi:hypothetical protein